MCVQYGMLEIQIFLYYPEEEEAYSGNFCKQKLRFFSNASPYFCQIPRNVLFQWFLHIVCNIILAAQSSAVKANIVTVGSCNLT